MKLNPDQFESRQRALEDAFFDKADKQLLANLRSELARVEEAHKLAHVSEIVDATVLQNLVNAGVRAESLLAMRFVPMIRVAWSDHQISAAEQEAVLKAAESENVKPGSPAYQLLRNWLEHPVEETVYKAWKDYISELSQVMPEESLAKLRERTESLCNEVAKATGGILGIGSVSKAEREAIDDCVSAYHKS